MKHDLCIVGLGYIGLPSAVLFAQAGLKVLGVDVNSSKLDLLRRRECPIHEQDLPVRLVEALESGNLQVSGIPERAKAFLLCLPTPVTADHRADLSFVEAAARSIASVLEKGDLVVLESTVPPNTCQDVVATILRQETGLDPACDYLLAHAPERVILGAIFHELIHNVRIVGGITPEATEASAQLYLRAGVKDVRRTTAAVAELAKVVENTFRDVNIAFANELAAICDRLKLDVFEVIQLANLHPRVNVHTPGIGVGGHCIPIDPWFLIDLCPEETRLIHTARTINEARPQAVVAQILAAHGHANISPIGILGVAYKPDVDDCRESPALEVIHLLQRAHRQLLILDPYLLEYSNATLEEVLAQKTVAVLTDHQVFHALQGPSILRWNRA